MFKKRVLAGLVILLMVVGTITPYSVHARGNAVLEECELEPAHGLEENASVMGAVCVRCGCSSVYQRSYETLLDIEKRMDCYKTNGSDMIINYEITVYNQCSNCGHTFGGRTYREKRWVCFH